MKSLRNVTVGLLSTFVFHSISLFGLQMPQTTTAQERGAATVETKQLQGTVVLVDGNNLLMKMASGEYEAFKVAPSRKFIIDGKELSLQDLKPGTNLTATITTTTTPITTRTITVVSGRVWYVSGNTVVLTLPNGENRIYKVEDTYRFTVNGQPASVHQLRKGMDVVGQRIVEEPETHIAENTVVTGQAPSARQRVAASAPQPQPQRVAAASPALARVSAPSPPPAPAASAAAQLPATLPQTGSSLPMIGAFGLLLIAIGLGLGNLQLS